MTDQFDNIRVFWGFLPLFAEGRRGAKSSLYVHKWSACYVVSSVQVQLSSLAALIIHHIRYLDLSLPEILIIGLFAWEPIIGFLLDYWSTDAEITNHAAVIITVKFVYIIDMQQHCHFNLCLTCKFTKSIIAVPGTVYVCQSPLAVIVKSYLIDFALLCFWYGVCIWENICVKGCIIIW